MVKLFISGIKEGLVTPGQLEAAFKKYGNVSMSKVMQNFGIIHMVNECDASAAIKGLNNKQINGLQMIVQWSTGAPTKGRIGGVGEGQSGANRGARSMVLGKGGYGPPPPPARCYEAPPPAKGDELQSPAKGNESQAPVSGYDLHPLPRGDDLHPPAKLYRDESFSDFDDYYRRPPRRPPPRDEYDNDYYYRRTPLPPPPPRHPADNYYDYRSRSPQRAADPYHRGPFLRDTAPPPPPPPRARGPYKPLAGAYYESQNDPYEPLARPKPERTVEPSPGYEQTPGSKPFNYLKQLPPHGMDSTPGLHNSAPLPLRPPPVYTSLHSQTPSNSVPYQS